MKTLLLPVEPFSGAKRRLTAVLSESERAGLARAMYLDVMTAILGARTLDRVVVLTANAEAADMAAASGFEIRSGESLNRLVERLVPAGSVMVISADLPTLRSMEIDVAMNECDSAVGLIPSHDGTKTNGIVMHSNMRIEVSHAPGSLQRHLHDCKAAGLPCKVLNVGGIAFDVDTAEDLFAFLQTEPEPSHTWQYIQTHRIPLSLLP